MIEWLDSAYPPNASQIAAARAAGYGGWAGYFAGQNILNGWSQADFDRVKAGGLRTMAYCSGWSDPATVKAQGAAWGVTICLDDESGIRVDGPWVPGWLATSGAGLYGNYQYHGGRSAAFHILAAYPTAGDPSGADWWGGSPRPAGLTGWQWAGSHAFDGITVDASWFDDGIATLGFSGSSGSLGGYPVGTVGALDEAWLTDLAQRVASYLQVSSGTTSPVTTQWISDAGTRIDHLTSSGTGPTAADILAAIKAIAPPAPVDLSALVQAIQANTAQVAAQTTELNAISTKLSNLTLKAE